MPTPQETIELLQKAILWTRTGMDIPTYTHSIRVYDSLRDHGFAEEVQMAGLLHDIIEDGNYTFEQLKDLWYSERVIELVHLSTYDMQMEEGPESRMKMMHRLIECNDADARAVKIADFSDNLTECHHLQEFSLKWYLFVKAPLFLYYGNKFFAGSSLYDEMIKRYWEQVKRYHKYFE